MRNDVVLLTWRNNYGETDSKVIRRSEFDLHENCRPVNIIWDIYGEYVYDTEFSDVIFYITVS